MVRRIVKLLLLVVVALPLLLATDVYAKGKENAKKQGKSPFGWLKGKKTGWQGGEQPPGLTKKDKGKAAKEAEKAKKEAEKAREQAEKQAEKAREEAAKTTGEVQP